MLSQGCTETTFSTNDELVFQSQECVFVLAVQPTENEEAQAVVFSFNYDTPALVPIYELVWNVKVDDIDPQQFTRMKWEVDKCIKAHFLSSSLDGNKDEQNNVTSNSDCAAKQIELYLQTDWNPLKLLLKHLVVEGLGQTYKQA